MSAKRRKKVLAIDDEPAMTEWLKMVLEQAGYEVRTALIGVRGEETVQDVATGRGADGHDAARHRRDRTGPPVQGHQPPGRSDRRSAARATSPARSRRSRPARPSSSRSPSTPSGILAMLEKAIERTDLQGENQQLKQKLEDRYKFANIIGKQQEDAGPLRAGRERRGERGEHPHPGRERHRQGADRERDPLQQQAARRARSSRSTARRSRRT